jgi:hypothetical protein
MVLKLCVLCTSVGYLLSVGSYTALYATSVSAVSAAQVVALDCVTKIDCQQAMAKEHVNHV